MAYIHLMNAYRKSSSIILSALAMAAFVIPAGAQEAQPDVAQPPQPAALATTPVKPGSPDGSHIHQITVDKANGLEKAIADATALMAKGKITAVFINVTTCDEQMLPAEINAKGEIHITGCNNSDAGPAGDYAAKRTPLLVPPAAEQTGVKVKSPIGLRGISATLTHALIEPQSSVEILNSTFRTKREEGKTYKPVVVKGNFKPIRRGHPYLHIAGNSFIHIAALTGETAAAEISIHQNLIHENSEEGRDIVALHASTIEPGEVRIEHNEFDGHRNTGTGVLLEIARPNVKVHKNLFNIDAPTKTGGGIRLINPQQGKALKAIEITENQFFSNVAIDNPSGKPIPKGAVKVAKNDFSKATMILPKPGQPVATVSPVDVIDAKENFWGNHKAEAVTAITANPLKEQPKLDWARLVNRVSGDTRFETAVRVSNSLYRQGAETVVIARHDVVSDSVSAVPLAEELKAPILLTQSNELHPNTLKELKRAMPKGGKVILMGGEEAISKAVEEAIVKEGHKVERVAGANRAATAVETAKKLKEMGKAKHFLVADGTDWQPGLLAGPAAAEVDGATLLTNGDKIAPETEAFLKENGAVPTTAIGDMAAKVGVAKETVAGSEPTALSIAVADKFFMHPTMVGVATTADFADALSGGLHIAMKDGPLLLLPQQLTPPVAGYFKQHYTVAMVWVYGGTTRFDDKMIDALGE